MNRSQIKHLSQRAAAKSVRLKHEIWKTYPKTGALDTPEIAVARKLVEEWDDKIESAQNNLTDQIDSFVTYINEQLLFADSETALASIARFEASTRETLPSCEEHIRNLFGQT